MAWCVLLTQWPCVRLPVEQDPLSKGPDSVALQVKNTVANPNAISQKIQPGRKQKDIKKRPIR